MDTQWLASSRGRVLHLPRELPGILGKAGLNRGIPDAESVLSTIEDGAVRRWTAEVIRAALDRAILSWLQLAPAERDAEMADRLATMPAMMGGAARGW